MIAIHRADLKPTLSLCFALLVATGIWLAIVLLSQLALMEPVTAPGVQSLADNGDALLFVASGDAPGAAANYASARSWVWFCIGTNGAGALLTGLWLRAAMRAPVPAARPLPVLAPWQRGNLIERAMQERGPAGTGTMRRQLAAPAAASGPGAPAAQAAGPAPAFGPLAASASVSAPACASGAQAGGELARLARIIDNLAFQTTLLAVNAAVEAARGSRQPPRA